jgi:hypothetical protein
MDASEFRRLAQTGVATPVTPETALGVWVQVDQWLTEVEEQLGDPVLASWEDASGNS